MNIRPSKTAFTADEHAALRAKVRQVKAEADLSQADIAREAEIPDSTLSQYLNDKYPNDTGKAETAAKLHRWLNARDLSAQFRRRGAVAPSYLPLRASANIAAALTFAREMAGLVMVAGAPGVGKTVTAKQYAADHPRTWYCAINGTSAGAPTMLVALLAAVGVPDAKGSPQGLMRRLLSILTEDKSLLIVDEAQHLAFPDAFAFQPDHIRQAEVLEWCEANLKPELLKLTAHDQVAVGGDFARRSDLSVMWPLVITQTLTFATLFVLEMRNVPFTEQEFVWKYVLRRLRRWRAAIDAQGNGAYLAERLVQEFGVRVAAVANTNANWWREHGPPVKQRFQDSRTTTPRDRDVSTDLRAVKMIGGVPSIPETRTTAKGEDAATADASPKRHADAAVAMVLAHFAQRQGIAGDIDFQSGGSALPAPANIIEDRGFGLVASELTLEGY